MEEAGMIKCCCPHCGTVYELTVDLIGQVGECAECAAAFHILDQTAVIEAALAGNGEISLDAIMGPGETSDLPNPPSPEPSVSETQEIPTLNERAGDNTDTGAIKPDMTATNTVKLPRAKVGMIPKIKDEQFNVSEVQGAPQIERTMTQTATGAKFTRRKFTSSGTSSGMRSSAIPRKPAKKWWQFWK